MFYVVEYLLVQFSQLLSGDFQDHEMEGAGIFWKSYGALYEVFENVYD